MPKREGAGNPGRNRSFLDRLEGFLRQVSLFTAGFIATPWNLAFRPTTMARACLRQPRRLTAVAVPPLTFLFACSLLLSISVSSVAATQFDWSQLFPHLRERLSTGISTTGVLTLSLPVALVVLFVNCVAVRGSMGRQRATLRKVAFLSYVPAVWMLGGFAVYLVLAVFSLTADVQIGVTGVPSYTESAQRTIRCLFPGSLGLVAVWSLVAGFRVPWAFLEVIRPDWSRARRVGQTLLLALAAHLSFAVATGVTLLANRLSYLADAPPNVTPLTVVEQQYRPVEGGAKATFKLYIENADSQTMAIIDRGIDPDLRFVPGGTAMTTNWPELTWHDFVWTAIELRLVASRTADSPFIEIPPWGRGWVRLEGHLGEDMLGSFQATARRGGAIWIAVPVVRGPRLGRRYELLKVRIAPDFDE